MAMDSLLNRLLGRPAPTPAARDAAPGRSMPLPGQRVRAEVLEVLPEGRAMVRLLGQTLTAEARIPLTPGQTLELLVEENSPRLVLTSAPAPAAKGPDRASQALAELLAGRGRLGPQAGGVLRFDPAAHPSAGGEAARLARRIQALVRAMTPGADGTGRPPQKDALPRFIESSGQNLLPRLAALAAGGEGRPPQETLQRLIPLLEAELAGRMAEMTAKDPAGAGAWKEFLAASQGLERSVEAQQTVNAELFPKDAWLLLALPLALAGQTTGGELFLDLSGRREGGEEGDTRLLFFLELTALGPLAVEALAGPGRLAADFHTDSQDKAAFLEGLLPALAKRLEDLGYQVRLSARFRPAPELLAQTPVVRLMENRGRYVSLKV